MKHNQIIKLTTAALLCAIGILIPMIFPKIVIPPASFTLASHVAVLLAMFISPTVALSVALVTTAGFAFAGFPLVIVLRALSHVIFVFVGTLIVKRKPTCLKKPAGYISLGLITGLLHAAFEVVVVTIFFFGNGLGEANYTKGYFYSVIVMIGAGTLLHHFVDFAIALGVWKVLPKKLVLALKPQG